MQTPRIVIFLQLLLQLHYSVWSKSQQANFKQEEMRSHLVNCFNKTYLSTFPCKYVGTCTITVYLIKKFTFRTVAIHSKYAYLRSSSYVPYFTLTPYVRTAGVRILAGVCVPA